MSRWLGGAGVLVLIVAVALLLPTGERGAPEPTPAPVAPTLAEPEPAAPTTATTTTAGRVTTTTTTVPTVVVEITEDVLTRPLGDVLPGFDGTLVATLGSWGAVDLLRWGPDGAAREPLTEAFGPLAFDAAGEWMAYLGVDGTGPVLHAGPVGAAPTFSTAASSTAWHGRQPGRLAWLAAGTLVTADLAAAGQPHQVGGDADALHAWDEAGFVVTDWDAGQTAELQLLAADGSVTAAHPGIDFVDQSTDGWLLLVRHAATQTAFLSSAADLADVSHVVWAPADARAEQRLAAWSPDGRHIAFLTYSGETFATWELEIWSIFGTLDDHVPLGLRAWNVAWSPDTRFVAAPGSDLEGKGKLVVYDRDADRLYVLELRDIVQHVELLG